MALINDWKDLKINYEDAQWKGNRRFIEISNGDGTISFKDMTTYTNVDEDSTFFGASDANQMNEAMNQIANSVIDIESDIINTIYPVGSIYMSVNSTSPSTLFGGTWEKIQDRFLVATGSYFNLEQTGGSKDAVVVSHTHTQANHAHNYTDGYKPWGSQTGVTEEGAPISGTGKYYAATPSKDYKWLTSTGSAQPTINSSGVDGTDKNLPPYFAVNMWKRTA